MEIFCFFAGIAACYVPSLYPWLLLCSALIFRWKKRYLLWFLGGFAIALLHEQWLETKHMPPVTKIKYARIEGRIVSTPLIKPHKVQFHFVLDSLNKQSAYAKILLTCYQHCPSFNYGERWRLRVMLRKPQNFHSPGNFDYIGWLRKSHIQWVGTVVGVQQLLSASATPYLLSVRQYLAQRQQQITVEPRTLGVLQALTLGFTHPISPELWQLFRKTGTTHLMVISGAHLGMIAGMIYWGARKLGGLWPQVALWIPLQRLASWLALSGALVYALVAGMGIPVQRSLIACVALFARFLFPWWFSTWQAWRYALLMVLLAEPHAVLMPGFYLSFLAVATLLIANQRFIASKFKKLILLQALCLFSLMPLTLFWFSYGAVNGLIANLIAIPWVGFCILPLALFLTFLSPWVNLSLMNQLLTISITYLLRFLTWIDQFSFLNIQQTLSVDKALLLMSCLLILVIFPIRAFILPVILTAVVGILSIMEGRIK